MQNLLSGMTFAVAIATGSRGAGTSNLNGASFDCQGHRSLAAIIDWGSIAGTAVTSVHWQGSDTGTGGWQDLAGTKTAIPVNADNKITVTGLERPLHRYNRLVVTRAHRERGAAFGDVHGRLGA